MFHLWNVIILSFYINGFKNKVIDTPMIGFEKSRGRLK